MHPEAEDLTKCADSDGLIKNCISLMIRINELRV